MLSRQDAEDFLYREAALLDGRRYEEWLKLFTPDGLYWIPIDESADPELEPSILYDNADQREQRIYQLTRLPHYAQMPPSRTIHNVSNVRVVTPNGSEAVVVQCNLNVVELRPGDHQELQAGLGEQRTLAGQSVYHLRQDNDGWRIALKKVVLIDRDLPIFNFSFIL